MNKYLKWVIEAFIWFIIIFVITFIGVYLYDKNVTRKNTYYVFFQDVDGLIKGSPVKISGYQIGYVSDLKIINEDVFVTFIITNRNVEIPDRLTATVESTGMGGSKSLELYVPTSKSNSKNFISTVEPRRVQDFYVYQNQIARNIVTMSSDFMSMFDDNMVRKMKEFLNNPTVIHGFSNTLDNVQEQENKFMNRKNRGENDE